ncbi:MAG: helix-turn-helix domain-containing protein [Desulfuromonadaceae bacterium]|nr:helix-turn-helix domain-containing protein [Desulfuromonadaceae bacterium]
MDWVLSQCSKRRTEAQKSYRDFVSDGLEVEDSPLKKAAGQLILGGQNFIDSLKLKIMDKSEIKEFSRQQRLVGRPSLNELFHGEKDNVSRNQTIKVAHLDYGYSLKEIGDHVGRHYSTISRIVSS